MTKPAGETLENAFLTLLTFVLCCSLTLIFGSLGSISIFSSLLIQAVVCGTASFWLPFRFFQKKTGPIDLFFLGFLLFFTWLAIQTWGQWYHVKAFFPYMGSWNERVALLCVFLTGIILYVVTSEILKTRTLCLFLIQYLVCLSALLSIYLLYVFFRAPDPQHFWEGKVLPLIQNLWPWTGVNIQPNYFVKLLYPGSFYALSLMFYTHKHRGSYRNPQNAYNLILLNLCFACVNIGAIFLTLSRAGIVSFVAAFCFYVICFILSHHRKSHVLENLSILITFVICFLLWLGLKNVFREIQTIAPDLANASALRDVRTMTSGTALQLIKFQGLWGVGLGNFQMGWFMLHRSPFNIMPPTTFNDFLWIWVETGIPGMLLFLGMILFFMIRIVRRAVNTHSYFISYFLLASAAGLLGLCIHSVVDPVFYVEPFLWLSFIVIGIGSACFHFKSSASLAREAEEIRKAPYTRWLNSTLVLLFLPFIFGGAAVTISKTLAYGLSLVDSKEMPLQKAIKLDPFNGDYPKKLASYYFERYRQKKNPKVFKKAIAALDHAIDLDIFGYLLYMQRAEMFWEINDEKGVLQTFERMRERFPNFYLAELTESIFYMEASVLSPNPHQAGYLEDVAVAHYRRAVQLSPQFFDVYRIYPYGSDKANQRYILLRKEGRIY